MSESSYGFRKAIGGWILADADDEDADEEVFPDGLALINRICEIVGENEGSQPTGTAVNDRVKFLKGFASERQGVEPTG
jgi:hypothetical protein